MIASGAHVGIMTVKKEPNSEAELGRCEEIFGKEVRMIFVLNTRDQF